MAKDLPEYEQSHKITPVTQPSGIKEAISQFANNYEGLAQLGNNIAQNAANQRAQESAIEAAQTPGQTLIPAFTQADIEFTKVYKQEEDNVLQYQGNKMLTDMFQTMNKNPNLSGQDLNLFEENAKKSLGELLRLSQNSNKPELKRALESQYYNYFYQLSNKVNAVNLKFMSEQTDAQLAQTTEEMDNDWRQPDEISTEESRSEKANMSLTRSMILLNQKAVANNWPPAMIKKEVSALKEKYKLGKYKADYEKTPEEEKPKYIEQLRKNPPANMAPAEVDRTVAGLQQFAHQYDSAYKGQQAINYTNLASKLNEGTLTQSDIDSSNLSAQQIADLNYAQSKINKKTNEANMLTANMVSNFGNAGKMSQYTNDDVNTVFNNIVKLKESDISNQTGQKYEASLLDKATIAQGIKRNIPALSKELSQAANYGNAKQATEALRALNMLNKNNPVSVSDLDKDTKALLYTFGDLLTNTTANAEEALKVARGDINVDQNTKDSRLSAWKEVQKIDDKFKSTPRLLNHIAEGIGATSGWIFKSGDATIIPTGLDTAYERLMNATVPMVKDYKTAEKIVFEEMSKVYNPSSIDEKAGSSRHKFMSFPPEKLLGEQYARVDKIRALKDFVAKNNELKSKNKFIFNDVSIDENLDPNGEAFLTVNGKKMKVLVESDIQTQFSIDTIPSWQFSIVDEDNIPMPLMDMSTGGVARWIPDLDFEKYEEAFKAKQLEKAKKEKESFEKFPRNYEPEL
ncbi:MAG TPA: hypothetical protein VNX68_05140 [Nitrosopumilaceae archaeon]|nr:hypothetical protein [Nitrosopumilaceae archaeon]